MKSGKKRTEILIKGSLSINIIGGIVYNIYHVLTGQGVRGLDFVFITAGFLAFYIFSERYFTEKLNFVPPAFYYIAITFGFFACYLGSYLDFYEKFALWDDILHFVSGILLGMLCIIVTSFIVFKRFGRIYKKPDILFMVVVGVLVSISIAVFWEFYECIYDRLLDGNMQRSLIITDPENFDITPYLRPSGRFVDPGLMDTMGDFFQAVTGSIIAGIYCFTHYAIISKSIDEYDQIDLSDEKLNVKVDE